MTLFRGLIAYPITPLTPDDVPDLDAVANLVRGAARAGVDGVAVLASSGAGVTFDAAERAAVVGAAVDAARAASGGDLPVHVAVSGTSTREILARARAARDGGASGLVLAPFSYVPLVDGEVAALFGAVADAVDLPVCFYNKPVQTGYDVSPGMLARLARTTTVSAVKDPVPLPDRPAGRVTALRDAVTGLDVGVGLSGDRALLGSAEPADAWHSGLAALVPAEYVVVRRARVDGTAPDPDTDAWLRALVDVLAGLRPVSGFHALADLLGVPTAPPRGPSLPVDDAGRARLAAVVARRPAAA
ncbi:dihydrodipicolinate synthase family protein [Cellulosimicrobium terreum]|nr:dihydrodipicolinate synthase family protein [Cellulosimicrobium terreum]